MSLILVNKIWCVNFFFHSKKPMFDYVYNNFNSWIQAIHAYIVIIEVTRFPLSIKKQPKKMKVYNYYQWTNQSSRLTNFRIATRMLSISVKINPKAIHSKKNIRIQENVSFNLLKCLWDTFNWHLLVLTDNLFPLEFC